MDLQGDKRPEAMRMFTNGMMLAKKLSALKESGLEFLMDTFISSKFNYIRTRIEHRSVMEGIVTATEMKYNSHKEMDVRVTKYTPFVENKLNTKNTILHEEINDRKGVQWPNFRRLLDHPSNFSIEKIKAKHAGNIQEVSGCLYGCSTSFNSWPINQPKQCFRSLNASRTLFSTINISKVFMVDSAFVLSFKPSGVVQKNAFSTSSINSRGAVNDDNSDEDAKMETYYKRYHDIFGKSIQMNTEKVETVQTNTGKVEAETNPDYTKVLSHVDPGGRARMVDVSNKPATTRVAVATGLVQLPGETFRMVSENQMKKGDVLTVAQLAGIMGTKRTSSLIPLCHNIPITNADVSLKLNERTCCVEVTCSVSTVSNTGVEMEALTGVAITLLTIYDMCKSASHNIVITDIELKKKYGGKSEYVSNS